LLRVKKRFYLLLLPVLLIGLAGACKKQTVDTSTATQTYSQLPDATNVLASLTQKNYDEAVAALVKMKENVTSEEQQNQYTLLVRQVKDQLLDAAPTDPKASDALQAYRVMSTGR
jgi:hypothetical protein